MMTVEILKAARELISDESHWTQGEFARNANGTAVEPAHPFAVRWCGEGALRYICQARTWKFFAALKALERVLPLPLWDFNDHRTHAEVLAAFDRAIELAEAAVTA